jgi:arylsulfatase A-like enzyme
MITGDGDHTESVMGFVQYRPMEVYTAALAYCDTQMGRILDAIEEMGDLDNTLVIYIQGDTLPVWCVPGA